MENKNWGGYKKLASYQTAEIICDFTVQFCAVFVSKFSRTVDQMNQAARSGKQNIAEGSVQSRISKKSELKLLGVALASLIELLSDYEDFLRQHCLKIWDKNDPRCLEIRRLAYKSNKSYETYKSYLSDPESAANCAICLIKQATYLLDKQISSLHEKFISGGGFSENLLKERLDERRKIK